MGLLHSMSSGGLCSRKEQSDIGPAVKPEDSLTRLRSQRGNVYRTEVYHILLSLQHRPDHHEKWLGSQYAGPPAKAAYHLFLRCTALLCAVSHRHNEPSKL
jgi:hypothetical protein